MSISIFASGASMDVWPAPHKLYVWVVRWDIFWRGIVVSRYVLMGWRHYYWRDNALNVLMDVRAVSLGIQNWHALIANQIVTSFSRIAHHLAPIRLMLLLILCVRNVYLLVRHVLISPPMAVSLANMDGSI